MKKNKIPFVKYSPVENAGPIQLITLGQARFSAMIYFIIGLIIGGLMF